MTRTSVALRFGPVVTCAFHTLPIACNLHSHRASITAVTGIPRRWLDSPAMSIEPTMSGQSQAPQHAAHPHVLAADDDPAIRERVTDYLSGNEPRVTAVP